MDDFDFRPATIEDKDYAYGLFKRSIEKILNQQAVSWNEDIMQKFFFEKFPNKDSKIILHQGCPIGSFQIEESPDHIWIGRMYIEPDMQGKGIGKHLINLALALAHEKEKPLRLEVLKANENSIAFYQNRGFDTFGENEYEFLMRHKDTVCYKETPLPKVTNRKITGKPKQPPN